MDIYMYLYCIILQIVGMSEVRDQTSKIGNLGDQLSIILKWK